MRTFIAIELPQEIKESLARLQADLKKSEADVKWVSARNIHLTLKFMGEIDQASLPNIIGALQEACRAIKPFHISVSGLGAFPKADFPRVIWVGVSKGDEETKILSMAIDEKLALIGIPQEDKEFSTHITIGRVRSGKNRAALVKNMHLLENCLGGATKEIPVDKVTLFKSTLTPSGPLYEALQEISLATT